MVLQPVGLSRGSMPAWLVVCIWSLVCLKAVKGNTVLMNKKPCRGMLIISPFSHGDVNLLLINLYGILSGSWGQRNLHNIKKNLIDSPLPVSEQLIVK